MENNQSIKILYENQIKRINNLCCDFQDLVDKVKNLFDLSEAHNILIFYKGQENEKNLISNEEDYSRLISDHKTEACLKLVLELKQEETTKQEKNTIPETTNPKMDQRAYTNKFFHQCDICLQYPIFNIKYICIICDQMYICENCESSHNHPLIKCKSNNMSSAEDISNLLLYSEGIEKNNFKDIFNKKLSFVNLLKDKFNSSKSAVKLSMISQHYNIKPNSVINIPFNVSNVGMSSLPQDTLFYIKNCRDLYFEIKQLKRLFYSKANLNLELQCRSSSKCDTYDLELHVYQKDTKIEYKPIRFTVKICEDAVEDAFTSVEEGYCPDDHISTLPSNKKEVLIEVIRKDLSSRDILDICQILDKHNWALTEQALKDIK